MLCVLLLGVTCSVLAQAKQHIWVVFVTSAAGLVTAWSEFSDSARKTERYTRAVASLQKLLNWWNSLGDVERASRDAITHLICTGETIISEERVAWMSTPGKAAMKHDASRPVAANDDAEHGPP